MSRVRRSRAHLFLAPRPQKGPSATFSSFWGGGVECLCSVRSVTFTAACLSIRKPESDRLSRSSHGHTCQSAFAT